MDIRTLLDRVDIIEGNQPAIKKYLSESLYNAPEMQSHWKRIDEGFIRGYEKYLAEVALTPDQIQNIFKQASGGAAGGEAPKDPGKLAALVDKVLPSSQAANLEKTLPEPDAGPVQGFEQKAAAAVQNLQGVDSGTKQSLMQMVKAGIQKPETQQLILAAVGAGLGSLISKVGPILSMIPGGGPVAAAITGAVVAGGVAVLAAKLRGDDWKTAFKGAIKPALMGGASAVVGNLVTTAVGAMMSGGGAAADQGASGGETGDIKGASLHVGQELPDGQGTITAMDSGAGPGGKYTITKPDGSTYTVDREMAYAMTGQQGIANHPGGPISQGATTGVDGEVPLKRGDSGWDKMSKTPTNPDGSPMTVDQVNAIKDQQRYGNTHNMSDLAGGGMKNGDGTPMTNADMRKYMDQVAPVSGSDADPNKYYNSLSPEQQRATDDAVVAQAQANEPGKVRANLDNWRTMTGSPNAPQADTSAPTSDYPSTGKVRANLDQWRQDTGSSNAPAGDITPKGGVTLPNPDGSYPPGAFTADDQIALNQRMQAQANGASASSDYPSAGKVRPSLDQWRADNAGGPTAGGMPLNVPDGINRLTGQPFKPAPSWGEMTPDQQQQVLDRQAQQRADQAASSSGETYVDRLNRLKAQGISIRESFATSQYVDKQATLRKWLVQESKGQRVHGVMLKPTIKEGIMDSIKGMFGGKKGADAPAAGGVTADALNKAWTAAGSPTDSEEVAKVLQSAGVPAETVSKVFADLKLPAPGSAAPAGEETPKPGEAPAEPEAAKEPAAEPAQGAPAGGVNIDDLAAQINKLAPADKQKIIAALQG